MIVGRFEPTYLELPREVLLASMAKHQRVFAVQEPSGRLLPVFVAITDGKPGKPQAVMRTVEHILNARLADAKLFWEQDRRRPLAQADLTGVTFHEKLGSMHDKVRRMRQLVDPLAQAWQLSAGERTHLERATELAKSDLTSTMVKEFPTLQGVMGKSYALDAKEPAEVAEAIEEQYLPIGTRLPKTVIGAALAVVEKYDTLSTYFAIGIEPTGDQDPFGLRRAAQGIVEIGWSVHRPLPLSALFRANWSTAPFRSLEKDALRNVEERLQRYLLERLYTFAWPAVGSPTAADTPSAAGKVPPRSPAPGGDLIDAVLSSPCDDVVDAMDRVRSLRQLDGSRSLLKAAKVIERTRNILKGASAVPSHEPDPAKFQEPPERTLWERYAASKDGLMQAMQAKRYAEATAAYGEALYDAVHEFFDRVMVNVKEADIQQNRLALMRSINALYTDRVADLSKLTILQEGKV
jgi:glycyl-tRNA synthetase beta chain